MSPAPIIRGPRPVMRPVAKPVQKPANQEAKKEEPKPSDSQSTVSQNTVAQNTVAQNTVTPPAETKIPETKTPEAKKVEPKKSAPKPPKPSTPKTPGKTDGVKVALVITNLIFLGVIGYLLYDRGVIENKAAIEKETASATYKTDVSNKIAEINRLQDSLKVVISEKQALGMELNEEKAKLQELEVLKQQLQNKQVSINALNKKLASFKQDYLMATSAVEALTASNSVSLKEKEDLRMQLQAKEDSLKMVMNKVTELSQKVSIASAVKMESMTITAFSTTGKELKNSPSYKAMIVGKLKVAVTLARNEVAEGTKEIYLRIVEPGGAVLYEGDKSFMLNGKKTAFTDKQVVDVATDPNVQFHYLKGSRYRPGKYTIEVYGDGKRLSSEYLTLTQ